MVSLPRSSFYHWDKRRCAPDKYAGAKELIQSIYDEHRGRYGYRRIACVLRQRGVNMHQNTVQRLMGQLGLKSLQRQKTYRSYKGEIGETAPHSLDRQFAATTPNEKWVTDVTEFKVGDEKLFFSPIKDLYNGEIIAYTMGPRPTFDLVTSMLKKALRKLDKKCKPLVHSDQGWQYQMSAFRKLLMDRDLEQSMSRKGNCYDNASMESFFAVLKTECFYTTKFESIDELKKELVAYIRYYNRERITLGLGGMSPVQYRLQHTKAQ